MSKKTNGNAKLPEPLYQAKKHFDQWRLTHQPRSRFSEDLWAEAVAAARENGHTRTARVLGLDYYSLKKRLARAGMNGGSKIVPPSFVELIPSSTHSTECIIEMEDDDGNKMRISLKAGEIPDVVSLSRSFWGVEV